jgi:hypothetical protein
MKGMRLAALPLLLFCLCSYSSETPRDDRLIGRWALDGQSCAREGTVFHADGTWSTVLEGGSWTLEGDRLAMRLSYDVDDFSTGHRRARNPNTCHSERIAWTGPGRFETRWEDGSVHRLSRCTSEQQPSSFCVGDCGAATPFDDHGWANRPPAARRQC